MNREDIIKLAREAGLAHFYDSEGHCTGITDAKLVDRDKERNDDRLVEILSPFAALVASAERSECAKVCEDLDAWNEDDPGGSAAKAIRARSNT